MNRLVRTSFGLVGAITLPLLAMQACSAGRSSGADDGSSESSASANGGSGGLGISAGGGINPSGSGGGCVGADSEAQEGVLPADIVFVVDNSGSMTDESVQVQASMNDFANIIVNSGIDAHIILISAGSDDKQGVCVPPPLGSGQCPNDEVLPNFRHVMESVGSSNGLEMVLSTYPQWKDSLRTGATKTVAIITDDDSAMDAATFTQQLIALDPTFKDFKFDGIVAPYEITNPFTCGLCQAPNCAACDPCCGLDTQIGLICLPLPADEGKVYKQLVQQTGGVLGDLCKQQFLPVFNDMATAVISDATIPCVYDIPPAPMGQEIDFGKVNVDYKANPNGPVDEILYVPGGEAACDASGGWYYDDPQAPTKIIFCSATCDFVQISSEGKVTVKFGCATKIK